MSTRDSGEFSERLWPSLGLLLILLLIVPAVLLTITPLNQALALPIALAVYVVIAGSLVMMAPTIRVRSGLLQAGSARLPVSLIGELRALDDRELRRIIGPDADARAHLLVRGHIHRGVRIEVLDPADPTPYWVLTSRKPKSLIAAIERAKAAV